MVMNGFAIKKDAQHKKAPKLNCSINATNGIYRLSEREIERYRLHGVAIARLANMYPQPINGNGKIDLRPLLKISNQKTVRAWVRLGPDARLIITTETGANACPARALEINGERHLSFNFSPHSFSTGLLSPMVEPAQK